MFIRFSLYLIPFLVSGFFVRLWQQEVALGKESLSWPSINAKVHEASYGGKRNRLSYSYSVEGKNYFGQKLEFCQVADEDLRQFFTSNINGKKEITIFYCPSDPARSVARPGMDDRRFIGYFILFGFTVLGLIVMERYYRCYFRG